VEGNGTLHGMVKSTPTPHEHVQASWKHNYRFPVGLDSNDGERQQTRKRKKTEATAEENEEGGKKNRHEPEEKAMVAKQPRQLQ
jgi:hypothetical protein